MEKTEDYLVLKIPLKIMRNKALLSSLHKKTELDLAISEGLEDLESGRVFGPFKNAQEFKKVVSKT